MHDGGKKAIIAAFSANLGIAIMKFIAFVFTGAASLLAESIHSLADTGNQALLLVGSKRSHRAPTPEHPFGYGPERYFWSFIVALVLFSVGGLFALYEGITKVMDPHHVDNPIWGFIVLSVAIILEGFSLRTAVKETRLIKGDQSYWQFIKNAKFPELPTVLLEDIGALFGLVFALGGLTVATLTDDSRYDAIGSISVGVLLIVIAYILAVEMKSLLIGESVDKEVMTKIRAAILEGDEAKQIIHIKTMHLGPDDILIGVKIDSSGTTLKEVADGINAIEARVRKAVPDVHTLYIEPDIFVENKN